MKAWQVKQTLKSQGHNKWRWRKRTKSLPISLTNILLINQRFLWSFRWRRKNLQKLPWRISSRGCKTRTPSLCRHSVVLFGETVSKPGIAFELQGITAIPFFPESTIIANFFSVIHLQTQTLLKLVWWETWQQIPRLKMRQNLKGLSQSSVCLSQEFLFLRRRLQILSLDYIIIWSFIWLLCHNFCDRNWIIMYTTHSLSRLNLVEHLINFMLPYLL